MHVDFETENFEAASACNLQKHVGLQTVIRIVELPG